MIVRPDLSFCQIPDNKPLIVRDIERVISQTILGSQLSDITCLNRDIYRCSSTFLNGSAGQAT